MSFILITEMFGALLNFASKMGTHSSHIVHSLILYLYESVYISPVLKSRLFKTLNNFYLSEIYVLNNHI